MKQQGLNMGNMAVKEKSRDVKQKAVFKNNIKTVF